MPPQANLDELRARFEASRSFEDDDDWIPTKSSISTNPSHRSTLTAVKKPPTKNLLAVKKVAAAAIKRKSVDLEASKKKWEPTANWEPPSYQEQAFASEEVVGYAGAECYGGGGEMTAPFAGAEMLDPKLAYMQGWRLDRYGRLVKIESGEGKDVVSPLDVLRKGILARSGGSSR